MPEDPTTPPNDPQAGNTGDPQPQAGNKTTPDPQAGEGQEQISLEEARKLRSESANLRKRLKEMEAAHNELKTFKEQAEIDKLSDTEKRDANQKKLEQQYADLKAQYDEHTAAIFERMVTAEVKSQAASLGVNPRHLDKVARFLDWEGIEPDESGNPTGIKEALDKLVKEMPELIGKASPTSGGATNPSRSQTSAPTELTEEYVKSIVSNPEAFNRLSPGEQQRINAWIGKNYVRYR